MSELKDATRELSDQQKLETGLKKLNANLDKNHALGEISPSGAAGKVAELKSEVVRELNKGAKETERQSRDVSFSGSYDSLMREVKKHRDAYMQYERDANKLETDIRRGKVPKDQMNEVRKLRKKAETEKREMERTMDLAKRSLSFRGSETGKEDTAEVGEQKTKGISFTGYNGPCARACLKSGVRVGFHSGG